VAKSGRSEERTNIFGEKYVVHYDASGHKVGESQERSSIFGDYTEHRDASGHKIGESQERSSIFGDYTEHRDASRHKVGESQERSSIFGNYTEHEGQGWWPGRPAPPKSPPGPSSSPSGYGIGESEPAPRGRRTSRGLIAWGAALTVLALLIVFDGPLRQLAESIEQTQSSAEAAASSANGEDKTPLLAPGTLVVQLTDQYGQPVTNLRDPHGIAWSYMPSAWLLDAYGERLPGVFGEGIGNSFSADGSWTFSESVGPGQYTLVFDGGECCQSSGAPSRSWKGLETTLELASTGGWHESVVVQTTDTRLPIYIDADIVNALGTPVAGLDGVALLDPSGDPVKLGAWDVSYHNGHLDLSTPELQAGTYTLTVIGTGYLRLEVPVTVADIRYMSFDQASDRQGVDLGVIVLPK
jgi:hypothetical protein